MNSFIPDYNNLADAAFNRESKRLPIYEHLVSVGIMEKVMNKSFAHLMDGDKVDLGEFFKNYCGFYKEQGYDTVSFECCIGGAMPGAGALGDSRVDPVIKTADDFKKYPWDDVPRIYFEKFSKHFDALRAEMPQGMKAVGGVGNGIFECAQDLVGFQNLCYLSEDDPELYEELFEKIAETNYKIWQQFMREFGDIYCVLRFGDDLGYKSSTMLAPMDVKKHIIPKYRRFTDLVHSYNKPFLLHSCGNIFDVMEDIITVGGINAKHSNEDQIAVFPKWVELYGDRIGNFGGIDTDAVCRLTKPELKDYIHNVLEKCVGHGGFAFSSGNSIPDYVPVENYITMIEILREWRGDYK